MNRLVRGKVNPCNHDPSNIDLKKNDDCFLFLSFFLDAYALEILLDVSRRDLGRLINQSRGSKFPRMPTKANPYPLHDEWPSGVFMWCKQEPYIPRIPTTPSNEVEKQPHQFSGSQYVNRFMIGIGMTKYVVHFIKVWTLTYLFIFSRENNVFLPFFMRKKLKSNFAAKAPS